jgi:hypothetical protein
VSANHSTVFRLDNETGELRTAGSMFGFVDGFFNLQVTANNSDVAGREVNTSIKVWNAIILYYSTAAWTMRFQILMKERPTKYIFKVNHIFRISFVLIHVDERKWPK